MIIQKLTDHTQYFLWETHQDHWHSRKLTGKQLQPVNHVT